MLALEKAKDLANPEYDGGRAYDDQPVFDAERSDVEELTAYRHYGNLANENSEGDCYESACSLEMERTAACLEGASI